MTKKIKVLLMLTHIVVLSVGFIAGARLMREGSTMRNQVSMISHYAALTDVARSHGDGGAYKKALIAFLSVLDEVDKHPSDFFDEKTTSTDKAFVYERLARLEKEAGNIKASDDYMNLAVQACGKSGLKDCSTEKIASISKKLEESSMFSSKAKDSGTKH